MSNEIILEGAAAARAGQSLKDCPYEDITQKWPWQSGFQIVKPDGNASIEDVFTFHFGGPPRRDRIYEDVPGEKYRRGTDKFETPPGDWVKLENYLAQQDGRYDKTKKGDPIEWNHVFQSHLVSDGTYDVTDLPYIHIEGETLDTKITKKGLDFVNQHGAKNIYIANGYQVGDIFLFAGKPTPYKKVIGTYGRGACAIFQDTPKSLLIIAEDD